MNLDLEYLVLLLELKREEAISKCKDYMGKEKGADFWYYKGKSDAYQYIIDNIKKEQNDIC